MNSQNRPLSPHLQVYKLPLTGLISITHRMTGVVLSIGLLFFVYSFIAIATGAANFTSLQTFLNQGLVQVITWLFIYALFFHFCHGIRHLIWDVGKTFAKEDMDKQAYIELGCSLALTVFAALFL